MLFLQLAIFPLIVCYVLTHFAQPSNTFLPEYEVSVPRTSCLIILLKTRWSGLFFILSLPMNQQLLFCESLQSLQVLLDYSHGHPLSVINVHLSWSKSSDILFNFFGVFPSRGPFASTFQASIWESISCVRSVYERFHLKCCTLRSPQRIYSFTIVEFIFIEIALAGMMLAKSHSSLLSQRTYFGIPFDFRSAGFPIVFVPRSAQPNLLLSLESQRNQHHRSSFSPVVSGGRGAKYFTRRELSFNKPPSTSFPSASTSVNWHLERYHRPHFSGSVIYHGEVQTSKFLITSHRYFNLIKIQMAVWERYRIGFKPTQAKSYRRIIISSWSAYFQKGVRARFRFSLHVLDNSFSTVFIFHRKKGLPCSFLIMSRGPCPQEAGIGRFTVILRDFRKRRGNLLSPLECYLCQ